MKNTYSEIENIADKYITKNFEDKYDIDNTFENMLKKDLLKASIIQQQLLDEIMQYAKGILSWLVIISILLIILIIKK